MMDIDDGYILWTGIWKGTYLSSPFYTSLTLAQRLAIPKARLFYFLFYGNPDAHPRTTADIVKMIDSQPDLASLIRRVRGGYLKIQGTWMPYEVSKYNPVSSRRPLMINWGCV